MSTTYTVVARRWARGWELHIDGVGVTQAIRLTDAEEMVRDYIARDRDVDANSFEVTITPEIGDGLDESIAETRRKLREAELAQKQAAEGSRDLARRLKDKGLSGTETAKVLGVTPQRVSQLLRDSAGHAFSAVDKTSTKSSSRSGVKRDPARRRTDAPAVEATR